MGYSDSLPHAFFVKIICIGSGSKHIASKVNGIGTTFYCCNEGLLTAGRGQQFNHNCILQIYVKNNSSYKITSYYYTLVVPFLP